MNDDVTPFETQRGHGAVHPGPEDERRFDGIRTGVLSLALDPVAIAGDEALSPRWNAHCAEMQSMSWLPRRTASPGQDVRPPDTPPNFRAEASRFWTRTILPAGPASAASLRVSLPRATRVAASVLVKGTKAVRSYPKDPEFKRTAPRVLSIWPSSKKPICYMDPLCPNCNSDGGFGERRLGNEGSYVDIQKSGKRHFWLKRVR